MSEKEIERKDAAQAVNVFLTKNLKILIAIVAVVLVGVVAWALVEHFNTRSTLAKLDGIESIVYDFSNEAGSLTGDELLKKQNDALEALKPYLNKSGAPAARANYFAADIYYSQENYEEARSCYLNAAKHKKSYLVPISYFNAAVCSENLDDVDGAVEYYELATKDSSFIFSTHAAFSFGRALEAKEDYPKASEAYQKLFDKDPTDYWARLAMDRLIELKAEGKIE